MVEDHFSDSQSDILIILSQVGSSLSIIGCSFIIITSIYLYKLNALKLSFELVLYVSIADIIRAFASVGGASKSETKSCEIQGFFYTFGGLASFSWVAVIAIVMYELVFNRQKWNNQYIKYFHVIIWISSFILALIPLLTNSYTYTGGQCWIGHSDTTSNVLSVVCFYGWLFLIFLLIVYLYCKLYKYFNHQEMEHKNNNNQIQQQRQNNNGQDTPQNSNNINVATSPTSNDIPNIQNNGNVLKQNKANTTIKRVKYYPLVLFICYFFAVFRRIWRFSGHDAPFFIVGCRVFFASIYGFGNAIVYGYILYSALKTIRNKNKMSQSDNDENNKNNNTNNDNKDENQNNGAAKFLTVKIQKMDYEVGDSVTSKQTTPSLEEQ